MVDSMTYEQAARIMREATKDKSYQLTPLGQEVRERAPATAPRNKLLAAFSFQRERETLQADLERWAKEMPPWMRH